MRKTGQMAYLELRHNKPIRQIVADAINEAGSVPGAAQILGVPPTTLYNWTSRLGIRIRKVARFSEPEPQACAS